MGGENAASDEWTFVSSSKRKKQPKNTLKHLNRIAQVNKLQNILSDNQRPSESKIGNGENVVISDKECISLSRCIETCMDSIEFCHYNNQRRTFHFQTFLTLLQTATSSVNCSTSSDIISRRKINEIICYGIGNFAIEKLTSKHNQHVDFNASSPPMVQLSCLLLIRKYLAMETTSSPQLVHDNEQLSRSISSSSSPCNLTFQEQQKLVPISYFEPLMKPVECKVLKEMFHVNILHQNERGKRCVDTTKYNDRNDETTEKMNTNNAHSCSTTLFYMPHCPMRLYSNVLWSNWKSHLLFNDRLVIFGNSFKAYDDRIISCEQKKDTTNAIFPILPFVHEQAIILPQSTASDTEGTSNITVHTNYSLITSSIMTFEDIERAFNDCVIISFHDDDLPKEIAQQHQECQLPKQPDEYIISNHNGFGEEIV